MKNVDAEYQAKVGYQASSNHLQDYKIYGMVIKMFIPKFLNSLRQPFENNCYLVDGKLNKEKYDQENGRDST